MGPDVKLERRKWCQKNALVVGGWVGVWVGGGGGVGGGGPAAGIPPEPWLATPKHVWPSQTASGPSPLTWTPFTPCGSLLGRSATSDLQASSVC